MKMISKAKLQILNYPKTQSTLTQYKAFKFDKGIADFVGLTDDDIVKMADEIVTKDRTPYSHGRMPNCS